MEDFKVVEFDVATGEEVLRDSTPEEIEYALTLRKEAEAEALRVEQEKQAELEKQEAAKAAVSAKLAALGLDLETIQAIAKL